MCLPVLQFDIQMIQIWSYQQLFSIDRHLWIFSLTDWLTIFLDGVWYFLLNLPLRGKEGSRWRSPEWDLPFALQGSISLCSAKEILYKSKWRFCTTTHGNNVNIIVIKIFTQVACSTVFTVNPFITNKNTQPVMYFSQSSSPPNSLVFSIWINPF